MTPPRDSIDGGGGGPGMVVVGAGQTGGRAVEALRREGWRGKIALIGVEEHAPYERPPLSKAVLSGEKSVEDCSLFSEDYFVERDIDVRFGIGAAGIAREERHVVLSDGSSIPYHRLLIATGSEPRRLDVRGADKDGVFYLRTRTDAERLAAELRPGRRICIVGGGFIGLEAAAAAALRGCRVVVIEAASRLLMRAVPAEIERRIAARHRTAGVDIRLGRQIAAIDGSKRVAGVTLDDGSQLPCDALLIGIGISPRVELAKAAGLLIDDGIAVDRQLRTSDPNIFAAGDVCSFPHPLFDTRIRLESWKNADEQGKLAARNMLGRGEAYGLVPWLWSDQYETTIQVAGLPRIAARSVERVAANDALMVFHLADDGRILGASGIGPSGAIGRAVRVGQLMIERRLYPEEGLLADPTIDLKLLLSAEAA